MMLMMLVATHLMPWGTARQLAGRSRVIDRLSTVTVVLTRVSSCLLLRYSLLLIAAAVAVAIAITR